MPFTFYSHTEKHKRSKNRINAPFRIKLLYNHFFNTFTISTFFSILSIDIPFSTTGL